MELGQSTVQITSSFEHRKRRIAQWQAFLSKCLATRLDPATFEDFIPVHSSKHPLPPAVIADLFLRPQPRSRDYLDPRIPRYVQVLVQLGLVDTSSVLKALYKYSTSHTQSEGATGRASQGDGDNTVRWGSSYGHEEAFFYRMSKAVVQGTGIKTAREGLEIAKVMAGWMSLFTAASASFAAADVMGQLHTSQSQTEMESARAAFVMLLLNVCESPLVLQVLATPPAKAVRAALSQSLASFVPSIQLSASQIAARLGLFLNEKLAGFDSVDKKDEAENAEIDDILESTMGLQSFAIPELVIENSRAGLYIYLNACLVGRPLIDDAAVYNYLQNRYQGDNPTAALHLILASFDVLANAVFRSEGRKAAHLMRSYLINKVPLLLVSLAATASPVFPFNAQFCIAEALRGIDTNAFPTLSAMFDDTQQSSNTFTDSVRQDFCFACCLHGLVPESSIEALLGEITYQTLPPGGRYIKENLVRECIEDPERIQTLIRELDNMDGNVGAVCQALTEVLGQLCRNKETMSLKTLCSQLARSPLHLDVLLLFDKPITILQPLCDLLDNWRYDEDQSEYQPVYEEFGSVLLLLLAFVYRYDLSVADIGARPPDSFVAKLLSRGRLGRPLDELTEQETEHVGGWLRGLFDNDAGGLGDDLMSSCPPQDFYMLISTLFHQITQAFSQGQLAEENLKSGVEYFVHTFLLPSLVTAILFLSDTLIDHPAEQKAILRILQLVLKPSSISTEAASMLSAVLSMVAKPLEHSLRAYQRQEPKSQEVEPLLKALRDSLALSRRNGAADHTELEAWTGTANGGLAVAIRHTTQAFVQWSLNAGPSQMPTSYSHRQFLAALKMLGAPKVLDYLLDEIKQQHVGAGQGAVAFDIGCALVCAPDVTNSPDNNLMQLADGSAVPVQRRTTLVEALKIKAEDWKKIERTDAAMAEVVVRLYRKVEAQMTIQAPAPVELPTQLDLDAATQLDLDAATALDEAMAVAVAGAPGDAMVLDTSVDLGLGTGGDLSAFGAGSATSGGLDFQGDDIFGSLGPLEGWGDMELS